MLGFLIEMGVFGLLAYTALMFTPVVMCIRRGLRGLTLEDDLLAALSAGFLAFFVSNFLYDSFSFRQGPYVFFFLAALAAAATGKVRPPGRTATPSTFTMPEPPRTPERGPATVAEA
jgi:O-antigen ligase